jgi:starch synthase
LPSAVPESQSLSVLHVTPECAPLAKTGGLGDVAAALPAAQRELGIDARILLPGLPQVLAADANALELTKLEVLGYEVRLLDSKLPNGVPLVIADCPALFAREGTPYLRPDGRDFPDNAMRFGLLSRLAAMLGSNSSPFAWLPDIVHCHDWPTALAPVYLAYLGEPHAATVVTIHNLAFQGVFPLDDIAGLSLPPAARGLDVLEYWGKVSFLKGGIATADAITTVSPTYAREIESEALGMGLDGVLRHFHHRLSGVLNGIDTQVWNPMTDPHIASRYGPLTLEKKRPNKIALKKRMGLQGGNEKPLMGLVARLAHQKGIDLVIDAANSLMAMGAQVVVVGTGDRDLAAALALLPVRFPGDFAVSIEFDEALAHQVEAGADMFLMPSRFEPCGMNQMYSQRYGTVPIANATGGLVDTIEDDARSQTAKPTGFLMDNTTSGALVLAAERAVHVWKDPKRWRTIQLNGMAKDFGWETAARQYRDIYRKLGSG